MFDSKRWAVPHAIVLTAAVVVGMPGSVTFADDDPDEHSVARIWNEQLLDAIRNDRAWPTVHSRNLHHVSIAMYDAWAAFDPVADGVLFTENHVAEDVQAAREEAISYAAFRIIEYRFADSPGAEITIPALRDQMKQLGFNPNFEGTEGDSPAAIGNRCAEVCLKFGMSDGANEAGNYQAPDYVPVNGFLVPTAFGTQGTLFDPNRWQPLFIFDAKDQFGNPVDPLQTFLTPHWGHVTPFGLLPEDANPEKPGVWLDPGMPAQIGGEGHDEYLAAFADVVVRQSRVDPDSGEYINISPGVLGNNSLGKNDGEGHEINPHTGEPYEDNWVKYGDYARTLAEFWADGPATEAPPGHWNTIANKVMDHPLYERRIGGEGPIVDQLEHDVKLYLALNGAVSDAGIACWGTKGHYDYVRPISAIRHMAEQGQSSDPRLPSYDPHGLPLIDGVIELITERSSAPGGPHEHLADFVGEVAVLGWPGAPDDPEKEYSGVEWMRGGNWLPYQAPTFVTPPFAGYTSGHSTFSRAAAEALAKFTGDPFFPGGMGEFTFEPGWLEFEFGPSETITLQWATYFDASDQSAISRIYGGIHPWIDDFPARIMGSEIGKRSWDRAQQFYLGQFSCVSDVTGSGAVDSSDLIRLLASWGECEDCPEDITGDGFVGMDDLTILLQSWGECPERPY